MTEHERANLVRQARAELKQRRPASETMRRGRARAQELDAAIANYEPGRYGRSEYYEAALRRRTKPRKRDLMDADAYDAMQGEQKAFRAARLPRMPKLDAAGISTKPWGQRRIYGVGLSVGAGPGPSRRATRAWERATGGPSHAPSLSGARRRPKFFGEAT